MFLSFKWTILPFLTYCILTFALRTWSPSWRRAGSTSRSRRRTAGPTLADRGRRRATLTLPLRTVPRTASTAKGLCKEGRIFWNVFICLCLFYSHFFIPQPFDKVVYLNSFLISYSAFFSPTEPFYLFIFKCIYLTIFSQTNHFF